jgi:hypothetical protein
VEEGKNLTVWHSGRPSFRNSAGKPDILTKALHGFPQFLQADAPFPSKILCVHHSWDNLAFDALQVWVNDGLIK